MKYKVIAYEEAVQYSPGIFTGKTVIAVYQEMPNEDIKLCTCETMDIATEICDALTLAYRIGPYANAFNSELH